jgi:RNA-directed DNA polymerase
VTASKWAGQLDLFCETADNPRGADGGADGDRSPPATRAVPKSRKRERVNLPAMTIKLGVRPKTAWRQVYTGRRRLWALSHSPAVNRGMDNAYFAELGLVSLPEEWERRQNRDIVIAPEQMCLALG